MTYLVGYGPRNDDRSAIELACQFARSESRPVRAVSVMPQGWGTPVAAGTDREFAEWAAEEGEESAAHALADLARHPDVDGSALWVQGRSVPKALLDQAIDTDAVMLVVGSGEDAAPGRIRLSSKTDRLVHSSRIPVAIAPRGYRTDRPVDRVTVGFRDDDASWSLLRRIAEICDRTSARLRIVTFVVAPPRKPVTTRMSHAETQVIDLWKIEIEKAHRAAEQFLASKGVRAPNLELVIGEGQDWQNAIESLPWNDGDVLAVGSSATHPIARVFLGSSATKIIRYSPVPVVAVPGGE